MGNENNNNRPDYIHEYLKPRKKYKKVILTCIAIFVASILVGVSAGLTITISQRYLKVSNESQVEMIVIARDEIVEETEEVVEETEKETTEESVEEETIEEVVEETEEPVGDDLFREVYSNVKPGIVTVSYLNVASPDLFDTETIEEKETFGIAVQETNDSLYILADAGNIGITEDTLFMVNDVPAVLMGVDLLTRMMVLRVGRSQLSRVNVVPLGNSFSIGMLDRVYLIGASMNKIGSADSGTITFVENRTSTIDGYNQKLYTSMVRQKGSSSVLVSTEGKIIGWMSDVTCDSENDMACVFGISPLKYIIEDLCIGNNTAYLGVSGVTITDKESEAISVPAGFYVQVIEEDSPAYAAGILQGDCITMIDRFPVSNSPELQSALDNLEENQEVIVKVRRRDAEEFSEVNITLTLGAR